MPYDLIALNLEVIQKLNVCMKEDLIYLPYEHRGDGVRIKESIEKVTRLGNFLVCRVQFLDTIQDTLLEGCIQFNQFRFCLLEAGDIYKSKDHALDPILQSAVRTHPQQEPAACFTPNFTFDRDQRAQNIFGVLQKLSVLHRVC